MQRVLFLIPAAAATLTPYRWRSPPTGAVRPGGWLLTQARLQADALTSHLPQIWPEVANSSWLGGKSDNVGGLHESTPYWLNGAVPLAFQLGDAPLLATVRHYLREIIRRQTEEGWLGPDTDHQDFWSRYPAILAMVQFHDAAQGEDKELAANAALLFFGAVEGRLHRGAKLEAWSSARAHDLIWAIHYFVDKIEAGMAVPAGAPGVQRLLALAEELHSSAMDWHGGWFASEAFPRGAVEKDFTMWTHGVNNAQAVKHGAVWARQAADGGASTNKSFHAWSVLMEYHGQPNGIFAADENLAGSSPSRGSELCMVVEAMWSLSLTAQASVNDLNATKALDALEKLAVNALPGSLSGDLWSHPYLQFANSIKASPAMQDHTWATDGPDAAMYGLAPQYECCTANFHQGYPKLIAGLYYEIPSENTLVSTLWMPSSLNTSMDIGGGASVVLNTDYPFGQSAEYVIRNPKECTLKIRLPDFLRAVVGPDAGLATVQVWVEGHEQIVELIDGFLSYDLPAWPLPEPRVAVRLEWKAPPRVQRSPAGSGQGASVFVGPLLLAPDLGESRKEVRKYGDKAADWDTTATRPWAYALPTASEVRPWPVERSTPGAQPFGHSSAACALQMQAPLLRLEEEAWATIHSAPGPLPPPALLKGTVENVTLLPYGCTALRVSAMPEVPMELEALKAAPNIVILA